MYNYQILTSMSKMEIYEKLVLMSIYAQDYNDYEETADHLLWLFTKATDEVEKFFFPPKEVKDVQLPENSKLQT